MKKTIYFITGNKSKFREAKSILNGSGIVLIKKNLKLHEMKTTDQRKLVLEKANEAFRKIKKPLIVDDTGIYFDVYNNFPGTYTKFIFDTVGLEGIERLVDGTSRKAFFKTLICYKDKKRTKIFKGIWGGKITKNINRPFNQDWQYNNIFVPEGFTKHLSEISLTQRMKHSHRRKALDSFIKFWRQENPL